MSAGQITQGRRIYPDSEGQLHFAKPGDYGKMPNGDWKVRLPSWTIIEDADMSIGVWLGKHTVTEHEDGTITASPSILWDRTCQPAYPETWWHGYLELGVWREV